MSYKVGKPVRVQFMRWDETGWDQFGPAHVIDIRAGIDSSGKIVGYDATAFLHGWTQSIESSAEFAGVPLPANPGHAERLGRGPRRLVQHRRTAGSRRSASTATRASSSRPTCARRRSRRRSSPASC